MNNKTKMIFGWTLSILVALVFVASGAFKLSGGNPEMIKALGGVTHLTTLGILELLIAVLFLIPRTGVIGSLLMIAYMGGAMAVHFVAGESVVLHVVIEILIWVGSALRFPELARRLFSGSQNV